MKNNNYISTTLIKSVKKNIITLLVFLIWSEGFSVFKINYYAKYKWTSFSKISWGTPDGEKNMVWKSIFVYKIHRTWKFKSIHCYFMYKIGRNLLGNEEKTCGTMWVNLETLHFSVKWNSWIKSFHWRKKAGRKTK